MRTRVKICGVTTNACVEHCVRLGADAIGFNMYPESPRYLPIHQARELCQSLPGFVTTVGLFVNEAPEAVSSKLSVMPFDLLQFHGDESNEYCRQFGRPYIKVLRIKDREDIIRVNDYPDAQGFLFDAHVPGLYGGTGERIDSSLASSLPKDSILAGGLNPDNVAQAIETVQPYAVDVSSGVESEPGVKDPALLESFFKAVQTADRRQQ